MSQALLDRSTGAASTPLLLDPWGAATSSSTRENGAESGAEGNGSSTERGLPGKAPADRRGPPSNNSAPLTAELVGWASFDSRASGGGHRRIDHRYRTHPPCSSLYQNQQQQQQQQQLQKQQSGSSISRLHLRRQHLNIPTPRNVRSDKSSTSTRASTVFRQARPRQLSVIETTQTRRNRGSRTPQQHRAASAPPRRPAVGQVTSHVGDPTTDGIAALQAKLWMMNTSMGVTKSNERVLIIDASDNNDDSPRGGARTITAGAETGVFDEHINNNRVPSLPTQAVEGLREVNAPVFVDGGGGGEGGRRRGAGASLDLPYRVQSSAWSSVARSRPATAAATVTRKARREKPNRVSISAMKRLSRGASCGKGPR